MPSATFTALQQNKAHTAAIRKLRALPDYGRIMKDAADTVRWWADSLSADGQAFDIDRMLSVERKTWGDRELTPSMVEAALRSAASAVLA